MFSIVSMKQRSQVVSDSLKTLVVPMPANAKEAMMRGGMRSPVLQLDPSPVLSLTYKVPVQHSKRRFAHASFVALGSDYMRTLVMPRPANAIEAIMRGGMRSTDSQIDPRQFFLLTYNVTMQLSKKDIAHTSVLLPLRCETC